MNKKKILDWMGGIPITTIFDSATGIYPLNTDGFDEKGLNNNFTYHDPTASNQLNTISKLYDSSVSFDVAASKYFSIASNSDFTLTDGANDIPCSFACWYYPTTVTSSGNGSLGFIFVKRNSSNGEWQIYRSANKLIFLFWSGGLFTSSLQVTTTNAVFTANTWHHIVCTYDGSKTFAGIKVYINGSSVPLTNTSTGSYTGMSSTSAPIVIGTDNFIFNFAAWGYINQLCYWKNKVISQSDVNYIYNSGNGQKYSKPIIYTTTKIVLAQRNSYMFATDLTNLYWSNDCGATWINQYNWGSQWSASTPGSKRILGKAIDFAYIFTSGTLIFATERNVYRSTNKLISISDITSNVYYSDGVTPFVFHTPVNASFPGCYFGMFNHFQNPPAIINNKEVCAWSNYHNVAAMNLGAAPTQVWATDDEGNTIKSIYRFGQNTNYRDDGTAQGGTTGTLLGDSSNSIICRHSHGTFWKQGTSEFYTITGDNTNEVNWIKHVYNNDGTWTSTKLYGPGSPNNKWMSMSLNFQPDGTLYFGSDATSGGSAEYGIFYTTTDNIGISATQLLNPYNDGTNRTEEIYLDSASVYMIMASSNDKSNVKLITNRGGGSLIIVPIINLQSPASSSTPEFYPRMDYRNSNRYVKMLVSGQFDVPEKTLFIKS